MKFILISVLQYIVQTKNKIISFFLLENKKRELDGKKILIVKTDGIGDAVRAVHIAKKIKYYYKNCKISIVCGQYNEFIFKENSYFFDEICVIDEKPPKSRIKNFVEKPLLFLNGISVFLRNIEQIKTLKSLNFDYVINATSKDYWLFCRYIGKVIGGGGFFNNIFSSISFGGHFEIGAKEHVVDRVCEVFGITYNQGQAIHDSKKKKVAMFLGGKKEKKISTQYFFELANILEKKGVEVEYISDEKTELTSNIISKQETFLVNGTPLMNLLNTYSLFIGYDGGILHYVSQYVRTVSFYSITNVDAVYPYDGRLELFDIVGKRKYAMTNGRNHLVFSKKLSCNGCFELGCNNPICKNFERIEIQKISELIHKFYEFSLNLK